MFEQDRVILRLQQRVNQEADIEVCFLAGSYGRQTEDAYSDLDVALIFSDDGRREFAWQQRNQFVQTVLPYVAVKSFDATHIRPYFHIALYSNGAKVDYRYETKDSLSPNPWDRDIRIIKDSRGWGKSFQRASSEASRQRPHLSATRLTEIDERFWVMFWDVFRLLIRGDHVKPYTIYLELLHFSLPPLLHILPPEDPAHQELLRASYTHDTQATARQLAQLLDAYLKARRAAVRRLSLAFTPNAAFESAIKRLVQRHL